MSEEKDLQPENEESEVDDDIIELIDEDGNIVKFKLLDVTEYGGEKYVLLLAAEPDENIAEDEVVIFRLNENEQTLEPIEDDKLLDEVFEYYQQEVDEEEEN